MWEGWEKVQFIYTNTTYTVRVVYVVEKECEGVIEIQGERNTTMSGLLRSKNGSGFIFMLL